MENIKNDRFILIYVFLLCIFFFILKTAWVSDDSFITMRTIDNFVNGYGLTWNVAERVQTYTHPLWLFVIAIFYFFTREAYFTLLILQIIISMSAVILVVFKISKSDNTLFIGLLAFLLSRAFMDYTTSGLENPLTFLILACFAFIIFNKEIDLKILFWLWLIAILCSLNRLDTILLFLPCLIYYSYNLSKEHGRKIVEFTIFKACLPLILWELFSIIYYGFPFPNTFYAKLSTGISYIDYIKQGLLYYSDSIIHDPVTLITIAFSLFIVFSNKDKKAITLAIGIILYMLYIIKIGGDFMSGRFFAAPLFLCVILLTQYKHIKPAHTIIICIFLLVLTVLCPKNTINYNTEQPTTDIPDNGIADERGYYYNTTGLFKYTRDGFYPKHKFAIRGREYKAEKKKLVSDGTVGFSGYYAGPDTYIIDPMALGDPLLSKLNVRKGDRWRIGHFKRDIPAGYYDTLRTGKNFIKNKNINEYYKHLKIITRGNIFSLERFKEILCLNIGLYDGLLKTKYSIIVDYKTLLSRKNEGTPYDDFNSVPFQHMEFLEINFDAVITPRKIELGLDGGDIYKIEFYSGKDKIEEITINTQAYTGALLTNEILLHNKDYYNNGFDSIKIIPVSGDGIYSLGHIVF